MRVMRFPPLAAVLCILLPVPAFGVSLPAESGQGRGSAVEQAGNTGRRRATREKRFDPGNSKPPSSVIRIPGAASRARPGLLGADDFSRAPRRVPARGQGRAGLRRGAQLAGRRARWKVRFSRRDRRAPKGRRPRPQVRAGLHQSRLRAGQERRFRRGRDGLSRRRWRSSQTASAAHLNLGMALRDKGDLDAALEHLRPVVAADPHQCRHPLRARPDAASEAAISRAPSQRSSGRSRSSRSCAKATTRSGVALKQQSAAARKSTPSRDQPGRRALQARAGCRRARRTERRARAAHRSAAPRRAACGGAQPAGVRPGTAGRPAVALAHLERAIALRPDSPRRTTTSASRSGTAARRTERCPSCVRASASIPLPARAMRFSEPRCATRRSRAARAPACSARSRCCRRPPPSMSISASPSSRRRAREGARATRSRAEPAVAVAARAGLGRRCRACARPRCEAEPVWPRSPQPRIARAGAPRARPAARPQGRRQQRSRGGVSRSHSAAARFRRGPQHLGLVLIQAGDDEAGIAALREAVRISPDYADARANLGAALTPTNAKEAIRELENGGRAGAGIGQGAVQSRGRLWRQPRTRRRRKRSSSCARSSSWRRRSPARTSRSARRCCATARWLTRSTELQEAARLEPESGEAHYQLGLALARAGRKEEAAAALQKGRELVAADDRKQNATWTSPTAAPRWRKATLERGGGQIPPCDPAPARVVEAQRYLGTALENKVTLPVPPRHPKALELNPSDVPAKKGSPPPRRRQCDDPTRGGARRLYSRRASSRRSSRCSPTTSRSARSRPGAGTRSATVCSRSRRSANPSRRWRSRSSSTSATPRLTRSSAAT